MATSYGQGEVLRQAARADQRHRGLAVREGTGPRAGSARASAAALGAAETVGVGCILLGAACGHPELPVVARGSLVEIATERDDPVCGGTAAAMDDYLSAVFRILGEEPPDRVFLRYEWIGDSGGTENRAFPSAEGVRVRTDRMMHEHEMVHAVHLHAWPPRHGFLAEGLAILLEGENGQMPFEWPASAVVDDVLAADPLDGDLYPLAWFLVSQIVSDHGFSGLREFWFALPPNPSPMEVRSTYAELFDRPFELLVAPRVEMIGGLEVEIARVPCYYGVCSEPEIQWGAEPLKFAGPTACTDDPSAIGPTGNLGDVRYRYVVDFQPAADLSIETIGGSGAQRRRCGLRCEPSEFGVDTIPPDWQGDWPSWEGSYQLDVGDRSISLPTDQPATLELAPSPP